MPRSDEELLRAARDEAYHLRVVTRQLRNQTKTLAAAYTDSEQRLEGLIAEIESRLSEPHAKEAQGDHEEDRSSHHQQVSMARR